MTRQTVIESSLPDDGARPSDILVSGYHAGECSRCAIVSVVVGEDDHTARISLTLDDVCDLIAALERQLDRLGG